jgi:hypothetical protein
MKDNLDPEQEMHQAVERWLQARDTFHGDAGNGVGVLSDFMEAHRRLLSAFDDGWSGSDTELLCAAYRAFLRVLVRSRELGITPN